MTKSDPIRDDTPSPFDATAAGTVSPSVQRDILWGQVATLTDRCRELQRAVSQLPSLADRRQILRECLGYLPCDLWQRVEAALLGADRVMQAVGCEGPLEGDE